MPKILFVSPVFAELSCEAKLLYGLLLDRMQLSVKNRWLDAEGKVYIYFSQEQIAGLMRCGVKKVRCLLKELDDRKGIGLITRVRQGLGNPDRIYVKKCVSPDRKNRNFQTGQNDLSEKVEKNDTDRRKLPGNDIEDNNTEDSDTEYLSFYSGDSEVKRKEEERNAYQDIILEHIGYDYIVDDFNKNMLDEIVGLMVDVVCSEQEFIRIGGDRKPLSVVKSQFLKLDSEHIRFVLHCMKENTSKVLNMRQYLLAVLYNAPLTISNYYSSLVQHDMYEGKV
ncbi:MAG: DUF6017 domain-containing protein [Blautia sp.]|nr:DUF6017 domain-containing protein [Blautia sp.]